jgi:DNA-binding transcriptional ArsR family regulator
MSFSTTSQISSPPNRQTEAAPLDRIFHALGDATRRTLLERLCEGPRSVSSLAETFPISLAAVVQHLQILEQCGIVETQKLGRIRTCRLRPAALTAAQQWIELRKSTWERRLDRLEAFLAEDEG